MISVSIVVRPPFTVWSYRYGDVPGPPPYTVQIQSEDAEIADRLRVRRPSRFLASVVGVGEDRVDQQIAVEQGRVVVIGPRPRRAALGWGRRRPRRVENDPTCEAATAAKRS
jgi:hypothetical protein